MKIKVSAKEFLSNGGTLKKGREFFLSFMWFSERKIGAFEKIDNKGVIWMKNFNGDIHPIGSDVVHVEIEVTPIYK